MESVSPSMISRSSRLLSSSFSVLMSPIWFWEMMSFWLVLSTAPKITKPNPTCATGEPHCFHLPRAMRRM